LLASIKIILRHFVKKIWLLGLSVLSAIGLGAAFFSSSRSSPLSALSTGLSSPVPTLQYQVHPLRLAVVHTLLIPVNSPFEVIAALSPSMDTLDRFAKQHDAIAVLNAGFFDPQNQQSTAYVTVQGTLVADPTQNKRLTDNPNLTPYLSKIFNRSEFRRYQCGDAIQYDIVLHSEPVPEECKLQDAIGGGPRLLPKMTGVQEGFLDHANGEITRDALGSEQPNARTAVGITSDGSVLWVMVAQQPEAPDSSGLSLSALADFMKTQGVEKAMNLDGGSSSSLHYNHQTYYGKIDADGKPVKRPVKSVLLVQEKSSKL
jgi:hypothetical protein